MLSSWCTQKTKCFLKKLWHSVTCLNQTHMLLPVAIFYTNWKVNVYVLILNQGLNFNPGQGSLAVKPIQNLTEIPSSRSAFPLALVMSDPFNFYSSLYKLKACQGLISTNPEVKRSVVYISNRSVLPTVISWRLTIKILLYHKIAMLNRNWPHTICIDYFLKGMNCKFSYCDDLKGKSKWFS